MKLLLKNMLVCVAIFTPHWLVAQDNKAAVEKPITAHEVVEKVTDQLLGVVKNGQEIIKTDPQKYFAEVDAVLSPVVDFGFIARNVMGSHWKRASQEQRQRFVKTFQNGLVETYAKGLANFGELNIVVLPPAKDVTGLRKVGVVQEVREDSGVTRIAYSMGLNKSGEWKLINVVLDGVNLGKTFRSQFAQAVKQNDGDIEAVINSWATKS